MINQTDDIFQEVIILGFVKTNIAVLIGRKQIKIELCE